MKNYKQYISASCLGLFTLTACMDEVEPTTAATAEQIEASQSATEASVMGIPARLNIVWDKDLHYSFGYGAMMQIRDQMTQDLFEGGDNAYSWWDSWARNKNQGDGYRIGQFIWNYYYGNVLATNTTLSAINLETATDGQKGMYAAAIAYRALFYLDMARMYEYLPTDGTSPVNIDGNDVTGLTVPITTDKTTEEDCRHNPRASHDDMVKFIESDLDIAEEYIELQPKDTRALPDLSCVYGLKARLYMWDEKYDKAKEYARKAIDASRVTPMSQAECLDVNSGFNDPYCWMLASIQTKETATVKTGIINWTSWLSNQTEFGYTGIATGQFVSIDRSVYDRISNTDFRKLQWMAPEDSPLRDMCELPASIAMFKDAVVPYASLKFRPNGGNSSDYSVGAASAYPLMRVEEMYFIEAEAAAHLGEGAALLTSFMQTYRDKKYSCLAATQEDIIEEIIFQKRVELWGEGQTFFDIKRLDMPVTRGYSGHNRVDPLELLNTTRRPAWMNIVIVQTEQNNNEAVMGFNNPDPSDCYVAWEEK